MRAVDTNVLVRLLVNDDPAQAAKARRAFEAAGAASASIWVADTVLVETVWTLTRSYDRPRAEVAQALRALAAHGTVALESPEAVREATEAYAAGPADFADCLLCARAARAGCTEVLSLDRGMKSLPGVRLL